MWLTAVCNTCIPTKVISVVRNTSINVIISDYSIYPVILWWSNCFFFFTITSSQQNIQYTEFLGVCCKKLFKLQKITDTTWKKKYILTPISPKFYDTFKKTPECTLCTFTFAQTAVGFHHLRFVFFFSRNLKLHDSCSIYMNMYYHMKFLFICRCRKLFR